MSNSRGTDRIPRYRRPPDRFPLDIPCGSVFEFCVRVEGFDILFLKPVLALFQSRAGADFHVLLELDTGKDRDAAVVLYIDVLVLSVKIVVQTSARLDRVTRFVERRLADCVPREGAAQHGGEQQRAGHDCRGDPALVPPMCLCCFHHTFLLIK